MADKRREVGAASVNECWRGGVIAGAPGWFFAGEVSLLLERERTSALESFAVDRVVADLEDDDAE